MSFDGLHTSNMPSQIYYPKYTILAKENAVFDVIFQNYFQESLFKDFICENCSSGSSESTKSTFAVLKQLKEPSSIFNILF